MPRFFRGISVYNREKYRQKDPGGAAAGPGREQKETKPMTGTKKPLEVTEDGLCWCGSGKPYAACHQALDDEIKLHQLAGEEVPTRDMIKTPAQIAGIRKACALNTAVLDEVAKYIRKGMTTEERDLILSGIREILEDVEEGRLEISDEYEDIHSFVEAVLTDRIGEAGKKLHTGRSRNDQVALDIRIYLKKD